ncbi:MAG: LacI family DNA-binding transcriptional regulator [Elusimicrobia bacterium]|nr:LacI family DNA-binding transcriptional regulator [Elusimicrobiota bacterium]
MSATMLDVAKKAGVSQSCVSFVLNGRFLDRISKKSQGKVRKAAKELNYRLNSFGRGLSKGITKNIGFIYESSQAYLFSDPYCSSVFQGIEQEVKLNRYGLLFSTIDFPAKFLPPMIEMHTVDGIVFLSAKSRKVIRNMQQFSIPHILIDPFIKGGSSTTIVIDNEGGVYKAVRYLIALGHRRIGFILGYYADIEESQSFRERLQGYKKCLKDSNIGFDEKLVQKVLYRPDGSNQDDTDFPCGYEGMEKLIRLSSPPTAVIACNDKTAIGALYAAQEKGLKVPDDISIIGFDDIDMGIRTNPPLTTIHVPKEDMGRQAVKYLMEWINNQKIPKKKIVVETKLVVRMSTGRKK